MDVPSSASPQPLLAVRHPNPFLALNLCGFREGIGIQGVDNTPREGWGVDLKGFVEDFQGGGVVLKQLNYPN